MLKHFSLVFVILFAVSCGSAIKIDPYSADKAINQNQKKNCKIDCKGLKGQARADCNKKCK